MSAEMIIALIALACGAVQAAGAVHSSLSLFKKNVESK